MVKTLRILRQLCLDRLVAVSLGFRRCCFIRGIVGSSGCILKIRDRSVGDPLSTRSSKTILHLVEELSMNYINCEDGFSLSHRTMINLYEYNEFKSKKLTSESCVATRIRAVTAIAMPAAERMAFTRLPPVRRDGATAP